MATTKDEFIQAAVNEIADYPVLAQRYQIGDPLITQGIASIAAMLADLANQVEVTAGEAFLKARDVTVLADAAAKGVLPFATPTIALITLKNTGAAPVTVLVGRVLFDQNGRTWRTTKGATVAAGASAVITARQVELRAMSHTVAVNIPFYTVDLSAPALGYIAEVAVSGYVYKAEFCNTMAGDLNYTIKSDENQELMLQFGVTGVSGVQPSVGQALEILIYDTEGAITLSANTTFTFEYAGADENVSMVLLEVTQAGAAPMDISTLRELCSYPGIYNENAVYLSNFYFLVRKKIGAVTFLSVWNETREEEVRGPSIDNINRLFVSGLKEGTTKATLQTQIKGAILGADDSYKIVFIDPVELPVPLALTLSIPSTYDAAAISQSVQTLVLENYGRASAWAKRGGAKIRRKDLYDLLRLNIPALTQRIADISVDSIGDNTAEFPEQFRYVTQQSLTIKTQSAE